VFIRRIGEVPCSVALFFDHNATGCINSQKRGHELREFHEFLSTNS